MTSSPASGRAAVGTEDQMGGAAAAVAGARQRDGEWKIPVVRLAARATSRPLG